MNEQTGWKAILAVHLQRYPQMNAQDVYKLFYQGTLGPEHMMPSADVFTARLFEELDVNELNPGEPLFEQIRPDGELLRIYLRPWLALNQAAAVLVDACLDTGIKTWGTKQNLTHIWRWFLQELEMGRYSTIQAQEIRELDKVLIEHNYPAVHHSERYAKLYRPSYRLVSRDAIRRVSGRSGA